MSDRYEREFPGGTLSFYLERMRVMGFPILRIEIHSTAGDIMPPYPFQFVAFTDIPDGADDPFECKGGSPFDAVVDAHRCITEAIAEAKETSDE